MAWDDKLSKPVTLGAGRQLTTLREAADYLRTHFATASRNALLDAAREDLMQAASTGNSADVKAATDQVRSLLAAEHHLDEMAGR
ncbi:hypothetical protein [Phreatobacter stygius]|uniref:DUF982 domain-containing protein n=1 Tax=Phreatobacter stygius TaxID=1940610 RepID=A0A4D7B3I8_9HYPH|nr:hypothetical protein [Phreatobacter stygius]QCI64176.1 hypothetical protein E8M01_07910 [Phreatobacter stygius]